VLGGNVVGSNLSSESVVVAVSVVAVGWEACDVFRVEVVAMEVMVFVVRFDVVEEVTIVVDPVTCVTGGLEVVDGKELSAHPPSLWQTASEGQALQSLPISHCLLVASQQIVPLA
jgi:hypothetical protein